MKTCVKTEDYMYVILNFGTLASKCFTPFLLIFEAVAETGLNHALGVQHETPSRYIKKM